jgi:hypothetical protein
MSKHHNNKRPIQVPPKAPNSAGSAEVPASVDPAEDLPQTEVALEGEESAQESADPDSFLEELESANGEGTPAQEEPAPEVVPAAPVPPPQEEDWTVRAKTIKPPTPSKVPDTIQPAIAKKEATPVAKTENKEDAEKEPMIVVYPVTTQNRVRIGPNYYQFTARKPVKVPRSILPILVEKGICTPPPEEIQE